MVCDEVVVSLKFEQSSCFFTMTPVLICYHKALV
jgi:hypothetical protein